MIKRLVATENETQTALSGGCETKVKDVQHVGFCRSSFFSLPTVNYLDTECVLSTLNYVSSRDSLL